MKDNKLIFENWNKYQKIQQLDEGAWESFKGALAKMGSMDDLVAVFSKKKRMEKEKAEEYIEKLFDKKSSQFIRDFRKEMSEEENTRGFPNMKSTLGFNYGVVSMNVMYDSIVAAAKKKPNEEGHIPVAMANEMIQDLKDLVEYYSDKKLADVYKHFNENHAKQFSHLYTIYESEFGNTKHSFINWLTENPLARFELVQDIILTEAEVADTAAEEEFFTKGDKEDAASLRTKGGFQDKDAVDTKAMKGLKSGKLPLILGLLGVGFSLAHAIAHAAGLGKPALVKTITQGTVTKTELIQATGKAVEISTSENGMVYMLGNATTGTAAKTMGDFTMQLKELSTQAAAQGGQGVGVDKVISAFSEAMPNPEAGTKMMTYMAEYGAGPGAKDSIWSVVNATKPSEGFLQFVASKDPSFAQEIAQGPAGAGTFKGGLTDVLGLTAGKVKIAAETLTQKISTVVPFLSSGFAVGKIGLGAAAIGSGALASVGGAFLAASGAIYLARLKGKKSSRAQKLNDLFQRLQPLPNPEIGGDEKDPEGEKGEPGEQDPTGGIDPQPENPDVGGDQEAETPPPQRSRLMLVRLNNDGIKFHPGRNSRSDRQRGIDREMMKKAQDQGITGANTDPNQGDLRNRFGTKGVATKVKDEPLSKVIQIAKKKIAPRSKRDAEPYITVGDEIYKDLAIAMKKAGLIKTARVTNNVKKTIKGTIGKVLGSAVKSTPPKKRTWKQTLQVLRSNLKAQGMDATSLNSDALFVMLDTLRDYGLVRDDFDLDAIMKVVEPQRLTKKRNDALVDQGKLPKDFDPKARFDRKKKKKAVKEWKSLSRLFKK